MPHENDNLVVHYYISALFQNLNCRRADKTYLKHALVYMYQTKVHIKRVHDKVCY